jgi:hypothetical protein
VNKTAEEPQISLKTYKGKGKGKGKATPLHAWTGPEGSRSSRLPNFMTNRQ